MHQAEDQVLDDFHEMPLSPVKSDFGIDYIFIPDNHEYIKLKCKNILYLEADGSYLKIFTETKTYQISTNLKNFNSQFEHPEFIRVSRKHIVNMAYLERINGICLIIESPSGKQINIPFSKRKRHEILSVLPIIKIKQFPFTNGIMAPTKKSIQFELT